MLKKEYEMNLPVKRIWVGKAGISLTRFGTDLRVEVE
jgi:hypothetical protein